jgi:hypothetical protein
VGVAVGVILLVLGGVGRAVRGRVKPIEGVTPIGPSTQSGDVTDLATGIGQAVMGVRDAIEHFERAVLVDPDTGALEDTGAYLLGEARRRVDEAEARLPRARLALGDRATPASDAVGKLRETLRHLADYIRQPGEGEEWSHSEFEAAQASLEEAREREATFLEIAQAKR